MDTTLRDGEQTSGVSFNAREKLSIARLLLEELCVSRIEIASARVSQGEQEAVRRIAEWAAAKGYTDRIEALGFIDGGVSLDWLGQAGCRVVNLLAKGSLKHCREQLRRTPQEHLCDIRATIGGAVARGMKVNVYLEDWSNGMQDSPGYVYTILDGLADAPVQRFMCPDTLGILDPYATERFCRDMVTRYPQLRFDFHAHNDYDLAVANTAAAVKAGFHGVHVTINGLGERAGNAPLSSTVAVLHDRLGRTTGIDETKINRVSKSGSTHFNALMLSGAALAASAVTTYYVADQSVHMIFFGVALYALLSGLILIVLRSRIFTHMVGFLVIENGVVLFSMAIGVEMPILINTAILLDILISVLMLGMFMTKVDDKIHSVDSDSLTHVKD